MGAGVYGAEAASRTWYGVSAAKVDRDQAARLAAVIPAPLRRKPSHMNAYATQILHRMSQMRQRERSVGREADDTAELALGVIRITQKSLLPVPFRA
ncbi:MAG TPA: transglycosylase domain-containing protein [Candidatus Acidoferrum sp.]|nr:transglycosylase domain-containing protein [Candidatus Acidoferrum sp.]